MPGQGLRAGTTTVRDGETQAGGQLSPQQQRTDNADFLLTEGEALLASVLEGMNGETQDEAEELATPPEGTEKITGGTTHTVIITCTTPEASLDIAEQLCKSTEAHGKVLSVKGQKNGVKIIFWGKNNELKTDLRREEARLALEGTASVTIQTSKTPLTVGYNGTHTIIYTGNHPGTTARDAAEFAAMSLPKEAQKLLGGERNKSEAAVVVIEYTDPSALTTITAEANKIGGLVATPTAKTVTILCSGEKSLAGAAELGHRIGTTIEGTKIRISTGKMTVGYVGGKLVIIGDVHDTLTQLQRHQKSPANRVVIDDASLDYAKTDERLSGEVTITGEKDAAGFTRIQNVERAEPKFNTTRMVGREREMQAVESFIDGIDDADMYHVRSVVGRPGVGKTRLLLAAKDVIREKSETTQFYVTATPTHTLEAGWFLGELINKITAHLATGAANTIEEGDDIAKDFFTSGTEGRETLNKFLKGESYDEGKLGEELASLINAVDGKKVVMLDNLEAMDELSARVLYGILNKGKEDLRRTIFLLAGRTGSGEELPQSIARWFNRQDTITLTPLALTETAGAETKPNNTCQTFVQDALGIKDGETIDEKVLLWIAEQSKGTPLAMVELCRTLKETGAIQRLRTGVWTFRTEKLEDVLKIAQPTGKSIIGARLERMLSGSAELQKVLSVLLAFDDISEKLMRALVKAGMIDERGVRNLQDAGVITKTPSGSYEAGHPLVLEEGRKMIPRAIWGETHADVTLRITEWDSANTLAENGIDKTQKDTLLFRLAVHGNLPEIAKKHAIPAVKKLAEGYLNKECVQTAKQALRLFSGEKTQGKKTAELILLLGEGQIRLGQHAEAARGMERIWNSLKVIVEPSPEVATLARRAIESLCNNCYLSGDTAGLRQRVTEWSSERSKLPGSEDAISLYQAYTLFRENKAEQALGIVERLAGIARDPSVRAEANRVKGMVQYNAVFFGAIPDQEGTVDAIQADADMLTQFRMSGRVLADFTAPALANTITVPDRTRLPGTLARQAFVLMVDGHLDEAEKVAKEGCRAAITAGLPVVRSKAFNALGEIYLRQGKKAEAIRAFTTAQSEASSAKEAEAEYPVSCYNLGTALLADQKPKEALKQGMEALRAFTVEHCTRLEEENFNKLSKPTQSAVTQVKETQNPSAEVVDAAVTALLNDPECKGTEFPDESISFYPLVLIGKCALQGNTEGMPGYVKTLAVRAKTTITNAMQKVTTADMLSDAARAAALSNFRQKNAVLEQLAA